MLTAMFILTTPRADAWWLALGQKSLLTDRQIALLVDESPLVEVGQHDPSGLLGKVGSARQESRPCEASMLNLPERVGRGHRAHCIAAKIALEADSEHRRAERWKSGRDESEPIAIIVHILRSDSEADEGCDGHQYGRREKNHSELFEPPIEKLDLLGIALMVADLRFDLVGGDCMPEARRALAVDDAGGAPHGSPDAARVPVDPSLRNRVGLRARRVRRCDAEELQCAHWPQSFVASWRVIKPAAVPLLAFSDDRVEKDRQRDQKFKCSFLRTSLQEP